MPPKRDLIDSPYGKIPKNLPDADEMNENIDLYIQKLNFEQLENLVNISSYLYHNYETNLEDNTYNCIEWHYKKQLKQKGIKYDAVGALPIDKIRTTLEIPMSSLNKIKPDSKKCFQYLSEIDLGVWSLKLDGVSGMAYYKHGHLVKLNTRGNGIIGGDVTYLKDYINIPLTIDTQCETFVVRGEFVISYDHFKKYKDYANPRAFVSGKVNCGHVSDGLGDIDFVSYELVDWDLQFIPKPSETFKILSSKGFMVVENDEMTSPLLFTIINLYKDKKITSQYCIDGIVLSHNYPRKKHHSVSPPSYSMAFKMTLTNQMRSTKVIDVDWSITRHGRYFPTVVYEYIYVDGVRLSRATGHNAKHIKEWSLGKDTKIKVTRSGCTIPQVKDVEIDTSITPIYPTNYTWYWKGCDIVLDDIENNKYVQIRRITHFFKTLGLKQFGEKTSQKLHENGFITAESIVKASVKDFMQIKGIGKKKAENYYNSIHDLLKKISPSKLMSASSVFNIKLGRNLLSLLFRQVPEILNMSEQEILQWFKNNKIAGFGAKKIESVAKHIPEFRMYLDSFAKEDISELILNNINKVNDLNKNCNPLIKNKKFVLSGFMDSDELEDYIIDHCGKIESKITKEIDVIICDQFNDKLFDAYKLGIPVYTLIEFTNKYNIPLSPSEDI